MKRLLFLAVLVALVFPGCIKVKHEMSIQPVHVTVEIHVKIDRELENFFADIDKASETKKEDAKKKEKEDEK